MKFLTAIICLLIALNCAAQVNGLPRASRVSGPPAKIRASRQLRRTAEMIANHPVRTLPANAHALVAAKKAANAQAAPKRCSTCPNCSNCKRCPSCPRSACPARTLKMTLAEFLAAKKAANAQAAPKRCSTCPNCSNCKRCPSCPR